MEPINNIIPMVIEQDGGRERSFDIYSRLLRERIVFVTGTIEDNMITSLVAQLLFLESVDDQKPIHMYVNSGGGVITSGLSLIDTMHFIRPPVSTLCIGQACSMGAMILMNGEKGMRYSLPNSRVMLHQPSGGSRGMASDIEIQYREIQKMKEMLNQMVVDRCGQPLDVVERVMDRDTFMSAEESVDFGVVDKIISARVPVV